MASEEMDAPLPLSRGGPLIVALDPLDGSSNIETNVSIGTIFSLLAIPPGSSGTEPAAFLRAGREQIAAGYVIYGPQTVLALTLGAGTDLFTLDPARGIFIRTTRQYSRATASARVCDQRLQLPPLGYAGADLV